jgi:hypothetical protein
MVPLGRTILTLVLIASVTGCVGTRIEYFTDTTYPPRSTAAPVEWLTAEPARPHVEVARITVRSSNYSVETLQRTMLNRARALGADAIVPDVPVVVKSQSASPYTRRACWGQPERPLACTDTDGTHPTAPIPTF